MHKGRADADAILAEAVAAHGGWGLWNRLEAVEAVISARGFLFTAKRRPVLDRVRMRAWTREPRFALIDFPLPGQHAELIGDAEVRICGGDGQILDRRENPRRTFRRWRRMLAWDALDFIYFCGYATWNYLVTPFVLARPGFRLRALEPMAGASGPLQRVQVDFPGELPAHCTRQTFYFDETRRLRRIDYTAEVVGGWARAAHLCAGYENFEGLIAPTRRRVLPRGWGRSLLPGPELVVLEVHELRPVTAPGTPETR